MKKESTLRYAILLLLLCALVLLAGAAAAENKWGYIDEQGNVALAPQWDYAEPFYDSEAAVVFRGSLTTGFYTGYPDKGLYGVINRQGELISDYQWTSIEGFSEGLAVVEKDGKFGYIDNKGRIVCKPKWDFADVFYESDIACVGLNTYKADGSVDKTLYGCIDKQGKLVSQPQWIYKVYFQGAGRTRVDNGETDGYLGRDGVFIPMWFYTGFGRVEHSIAIEFKRLMYKLYGSDIPALGGFIRVENYMGSSAVSDFRDGLGCFQYNNKYGYCDMQGKIVIEPQWDFAFPFSDSGYAIVFTGTVSGSKRSDGQYGFIDRTGAVVGGIQWSSVNDFSNGLARVEKDGLYGYINTKGEIVSAPQWTEAGDFTGSLVKVKKGSVYGYIDTDGRIVSEPQWTDAGDFTGSPVYVWKDDLYGYMDSTGKVFTGLIYASARSFYNGLAPVKLAPGKQQTPAKQAGFDFKQATWGMKKEDITAFEGEPAGTGSASGGAVSYIYYARALYGYDATLAYYFDSNGLDMTGYLFTETYTDAAQYIAEYDAIRQALTEKYGAPYADQENWTDESKKAYYADDKPSALLAGYLSYATGYTDTVSGRTLIALQMSTKDGKVTAFVYFMRKE